MPFVPVQFCFPFASSYAYRNAEASLVAPFEYVAIPVSVLWGIFIWNEWPDALSLGMFLILLGGIYAVYRERKLNIRCFRHSDACLHWHECE